MILTLLLPWFPIILAVGVGGRLLGRPRGLGLGFLCALFWVVLVQASEGVGIWGNAWSFATMVAGAVAITLMGRWSGEAPSPDRALAGSAAGNQHVRSAICDDGLAGVRKIGAAIDRFDDWITEQRDTVDPWPRFDEFIRAVLYECCDATHVRPFRVLSGGAELAALTEDDALDDEDRLSARAGIVGHVVTTGRSYLAGDATQGELVGRLAAESTETIDWCFAIRNGTQRRGVVVVGRLGADPPGADRIAFLYAMERLINQFWRTLAETVLSRSAVQVDPVSGLLTRAAFLRAGEESLRESYRQGEPVATVVFALEGLRELNDSGHWDRSDELIKEVSAALRRKVRMEDQLGWFDGSRIVLLLRRVDSELASLIVSQMMSRIAALCGDEVRWGVATTVRCGVTGSGTSEPDLRTLVSRALTQCRRARVERVPMASDLGAARQTAGATA